MKDRKKNKSVANTSDAPSSLVFFLAKKQKKTVNKEAERKRGSAFISAPFPPLPPRGLACAARGQKKRTSELKMTKQQTGRCPESLPSSPYRGGSCISPPSPILSKTSIITKKSVVAKRHISRYIYICVCVCLFYMPRMS